MTGVRSCYDKEINNLAYYLPCTAINFTEVEFLADILKSRANECFDSFPKDLQVMIKDLDRM